MSAREYDLENPFTVEETEHGYTIIEYDESGAAQSIINKFHERNGSRTLRPDYLPGINSGFQAEITSKGGNFTGLVYFGNDKILASQEHGRELEELSKEVLE